MPEGRRASTREPEELLHARLLVGERALEGVVAHGVVGELRLQQQPPVPDRGVAPADDAVAPEQRQGVVAELALRRRRVGLEAVGPAPEQLEAAPVPDDRVERARAGAPRRRARSATSAGSRRPASTSRRRRCARSRAARAPPAARRATPSAQMRRAVAEQVGQVAEARCRQRRVLAQHQLEQRRRALGARGRGSSSAGGCVDRLVDAGAVLAPRDAQQAAVVHAVEQVRRRQAGAAPGVGDAAVREVRLDDARMGRAVLADEGEHLVRLALRRRRPTCAGRARMHQRQVLARQEAVVDEAVLLDREPRVAALEVAGAVAGDAMAQGQVLGPRRRADRVGLDEAELLDRPERGWWA